MPDRHGALHAGVALKGHALLELERPEDALRVLDRACAEVPGSLAAIELRGQALARLGRADEAEREFRRVANAGRTD